MGAGPAGVAAGIEARRLGLDALVVDKAGFPRDKTCGDGLTTGALRLLEALGLDVRTLPSYAPVTETVLVSPTGREVVVPLPADGAYAGVVPRVELDAALVDLARAHGVEVREARRRRRRRRGPRRRTLADGTIVATAVDRRRRRPLLARAPHARRGAARELGTWHAFRQYFTGVDDRRLWVLFEEDFLPGYAWVFPVGDGRANVGFGVLRDRHDGAERQGARRAVAFAHRSSERAPRPRPARRAPRAPMRAWPIPAAYDRARLAHGRALFVGDAANVVDPMTGEGIAQALETGTLAARAIAASPDDPDAVADALPHRRRPCAGRRPPLRRAAATRPPRAARRPRRDRRRRAHAVDPTQLRPLDVRGLPARARAHAAPLAQGRARPGRRLPGRLGVDVLPEALQAGLGRVARGASA